MKLIRYVPVFVSCAALAFFNLQAEVVPAMMRLGAGAVKPEGWLKDRAEAARDGLTGHMDDVSIHFRRAWTADWNPRGKYLNWCGDGPQNDFSWSSEGGAYWFDGLVRLSRQLDDPQLRALADKRLEPLLSKMHPNSIGFLWWLDRRQPEQQNEVDTKGAWQYWVQGPAERMVSAYYEATGDERAKRALEWAFDDPKVAARQGRGATYFSGLVDAARLTNSEQVKKNIRIAVDDLIKNSEYAKPPKPGLKDTLHFTRKDIQGRHGVFTSEQLLSVFRAYLFTGDTKLRDTVLAWYAFLDKYCRQPYGMTMMDEEWGWAGAKRGTETCDVAAESCTRQEIFAVLGDGKWGDDIEAAQFNAAPATVTRDFKRHVYHQMPNRLGVPDDAKLFSCGSFSHCCYNEAVWPLCCSAALNRILPNFLQSMWMKTAEGGVAATLYGPCRFATELKGGRIALVEKTEYPFAEKIEIVLSEAPKGLLPIKLRIPGWAEEHDVAVNGLSVNAAKVKGFVTVAREWKAGDVITVTLPMKPRVVVTNDRNDHCRVRASVYLGPLLMAYGFPEKNDNAIAGSMREPVLDLASVKTARVIRKPLPAKWNWPLDSPLKIVVREPDGQELTLVPYGCTKLRISMFDVVGENRGLPVGCSEQTMSEKYWQNWNAQEQAKIDADIERYRKADAKATLDLQDGTEVEVEQISHEFRFGAHIFNFNQLGKKEYNDAYKASYGPGGIFNGATVAFYWDKYEPTPGRYRAGGDYEDTERFWNSLKRSEAMEHPYWRRPAPGPVIDFCRGRGVRVHGHILIWGNAKPTWIFDDFCPDSEKDFVRGWGIVPNDQLRVSKTSNWCGDYSRDWKNGWKQVYLSKNEQQIAEAMPTFVANMRKIFRNRVFGVAERFGQQVESWDVVNESSSDWKQYGKARTGLPVWRSKVYGLMPGDYPLMALLDCKEALPAWSKLCINDFNIEPEFFDQVRTSIEEGARIDVVGCQMHIFDINEIKRLALGEKSEHTWVNSPAQVREHLDLMAKTGRQLHLSEITIAAPGADERSRQIQAILTRNLYRAWFSHPKMMGITWWNTVDGGGVKGEPLVSGLFTSDLKRKPAYDALDQLINSEWNTRIKVRCQRSKDNDVGAEISFRGFKGKYRLSWKCKCGMRIVRYAVLSDSGLKILDCPKHCCRRTLIDYTVDGKKAKANPETGRLDLRKICPQKMAPNCTTEERTAVVKTKYFAKTAGKKTLWRLNDYFGHLYVNGEDCGKIDGPWDGVWLTKEVEFNEGENEIEVRARCGSSGLWYLALGISE